MIKDPVGRFGMANLELRDKAEMEGWDDDDYLRASERIFRLYVIEFLQAWTDGLLEIAELRDGIR